MNYDEEHDDIEMLDLAEGPVIQQLTKDSPQHKKLLNAVMERIKYSQRHMTEMHSKWQAAELKMQAYINLEDAEKIVKANNDTGEVPDLISLQVPYTFSTIMTIVTYLTHTFTGRKPIFQLSATNDQNSAAVQGMEQLLQFNIDYLRLIEKFIQFFKDGEIYGVAIMRALWTEKQRARYVDASTTLGETGRAKQMATVFEGTEVMNIDPFMFFPDPRYPMTEVSEKGEFVFWRSFEGKFKLQQAQANEEVFHIGSIGSAPRGDDTMRQSKRDQRIGVSKHDARDEWAKDNTVQLDQGTIELIPKDYGLSESTVPEKWLVTIANERQIIQCEPFEYNHDMHPVVVAEPDSMGYTLGSLSAVDMLGPIQDTISWFLNSHIFNVRSALNNTFVVNPQMVEIRDMLNPPKKGGRIIRMKPSAMFGDVRQALQQLPVGDVTSGHVGDVQNMMRIGDTLSAVTDNLRGINSSGGRKTATEVRTAGEAAASRLAFKARVYSIQGFVPLGSMMSINYQQFMSQEWNLRVNGSDEMMNVAPGSVDGNFTFPIHDGTLPLDKFAMVDVWREILMVVMQSPQLAQEYNVGKIFEFIAELSGARNIQAFKTKVNPTQMSPEEMAQQAEQGNMLPVGGPNAGI